MKIQEQQQRKDVVIRRQTKQRLNDIYNVLLQGCTHDNTNNDECNKKAIALHNIILRNNRISTARLTQYVAQYIPCEMMVKGLMEYKKA